MSQADPALPAAPLLLLEDVWYAYDAAGLPAERGPEGTGDGPDSRGPALRGVSLAVEAGERVAVLGRNGSGKTTLARHLNGLLRPQRGRVLVAGEDTARRDVGQLAATVGFVFQNPDHQLFSRSVREEIAFGPHNLGLPAAEVDARTEDALRALGLDPLAAQPPASLGFAQRRLVAIASALAMRPRALVLDEPFAGLPWPLVAQVGELLRALADGGVAVVAITHQMRAVAEYATRCVVLDAGRIVADASVDAVLADAPLLERAGLAPPAVVRLGDALRPLGFSGRTVRVADFVEEYRALRGNHPEPPR